MTSTDGRKYTIKIERQTSNIIITFGTQKIRKMKKFAVLKLELDGDFY